MSLRKSKDLGQEYYFWEQMRSLERREAFWSQSQDQGLRPKSFSWSWSHLQLCNLEQLIIITTMLWMFVFSLIPPYHNSNAEILMANVMVSKWGLWEVLTLWEWRTHEWDECAHKRGSREIPHSCTVWGCSEQTLAMNKKRFSTRVWPRCTLILDFPVSRIERINSCYL